MQLKAERYASGRFGASDGGSNADPVDATHGLSPEVFRQVCLELPLYEKLQSGEVIATFAEGFEAERTEIPSDHWNFLTIDFKRNEVFLEEGSGPISVNSDKAKRARTEVRRFLLIHGRANTPSPRASNGNSQDSTIRVERKCRDVIAEEAKSDRVWTKRAMFEHAKAKYKDLSRRAFDRAWADAAPDSWKRPGRKSSRPNRNGES